MMDQERLEGPDFLEELIAERTARNPEFPELMKAAARRRILLKELAYLLDARAAKLIRCRG